MIGFVKGLINIQDQVTLGSDGFGRVATGEHVESFPDGVIICPSVHWGDQESYPSENFHILGMPSHGTFTNRIMVPIENIFASPKHLNRFEAAALPLAGLTAYRAVFTKGKVKRGAKVLDFWSRWWCRRLCTSVFTCTRC